jgi:hypothetical protein
LDRAVTFGYPEPQAICCLAPAHEIATFVPFVALDRSNAPPTPRVIDRSRFRRERAMPEIELCRDKDGPKTASVQAGDPGVIPSVGDVVCMYRALRTPGSISVSAYLAAISITTSRALSQWSGLFVRTCKVSIVPQPSNINFGTQTEAPCGKSPGRVGSSSSWRDQRDRIEFRMRSVGSVVESTKDGRFPDLGTKKCIIAFGFRSSALHFAAKGRFE